VNDEVKGHCDAIIERLDVLIPLSNGKGYKKKLKKLRKKTKKLKKRSGKMRG
jgi:hypothetical protein